MGIAMPCVGNLSLTNHLPPLGGSSAIIFSADSVALTWRVCADCAAAVGAMRWGGEQKRFDYSLKLYIILSAGKMGGKNGIVLHHAGNRPNPLPKKAPATKPFRGRDLVPKHENPP